MTLEDIKKDMNTLNGNLLEIGMALDFNENEWEEFATGMVNRILEDESVRTILLTGTPEERKEYLEVIKTGIQNGIEVLKECSKELHDLGRTDKEMAFNNVTIQSERLADTIIKMESIENDEEEFVISDEERIVDLEKKIYYIDSTIKLASEFERLEEEMTLEDGKTVYDVAVVSSKEIQKGFSEFEKELKMINELRNSENKFMELLAEMNEHSFNSTIDMNDEEQKEKVAQMVKLAGIIDTVDYLDKRDPNKLRLSNPKYVDKNGEAIEANEAVEFWLGTLNAKLDIVAKNKKMNLDPDFLNQREKIIKEKFLEKYKNSWAAKELSSDMYKKVLEENDFNVEDLKNSIVDLSERLKKYKFLSKKKPEELVDYKKEAEKLLGHYKTLANGSKNVTLNGKVKQLQTDMTDISRKYDAVEEILKLNDDDEFKKEIESKAMVLAGDRPTDRWYHKFARFITFGRYKTPEQKYEIKLYGKRADVVGEIMKENKKKVDEATQNVEYDKDAYRMAARKKIYDDRNIEPEKKKFNKKQVLRTRDNSQPLTR